MNIGYDIELLFEQRLRQIGYEGACRPAREDCGVDYVLYTKNGWVGIQVKSAKGNNRGRSLRMKLDGSPKKPLKMQVATKGGRGSNKTLERYRQVGVSVFALHHKGVFYLVPITESRASGTYVSATSAFREAWHEVLGAPVNYQTPEKREIDEMESLFNRSPS